MKQIEPQKIQVALTEERITELILRLFEYDNMSEDQAEALITLVKGVAGDPDVADLISSEVFKRTADGTAAADAYVSRVLSAQPREKKPRLSRRKGASAIAA